MDDRNEDELLRAVALENAHAILAARKRAEEELIAAQAALREETRQSEERFRLLVEGVSDYAIFMLDANGYVLTWNSGAERIKGYKANEIIGKHFSTFYPADAKEAGWPEHVLRGATEKGRFTDEGWRLRKDGSRFWAGVAITALHDGSGRLRGFAKLTRDLSERQRVDELAAAAVQRDELLEAERNARMEAQRAARIKDEFLATLSHELRTPLNAILGWTQLLRSQAAPKPVDVQHALEVIERNTRSQARLIDDLLDLSRIMAGRVRLDVQQLGLTDIVRGAIESVEPAAMAKGIRLEEVLDPLGGVISGDPGRLQQVLWNLLTNAVKFTPKGGRVQVLLQRVSSHIEISVSDTGIGIPAGFLPHVFDRFSQGDSSTSRRYGGLGLGLAISKQLVELHGGTLRVKSPGERQGATFIVTLPLTLLEPEGESRQRVHPSHAAADNGEPPPRLAGLHVLAVDDETDARDLLKRALEERGARVTLASSGEEALAVLASTRPDLLISDIGMTDMDGFQLMRRLRSTETGRRLPALALTAFARTEDRKRALLAGYHAHLAKPFDVSELVVVVAGLAGRT